MAGDDQRRGPGSTPGWNQGDRSGQDFGRESDSEITVPNIFGGAPRDDDPAAILPGLSARETPQPAAWEQPQAYVPDVPRAEPQRTDPYRAGLAGEPTRMTSLPPDGNRRRNALFGVIGVIGLTVAVVLAAILIAPKWSKDNAQPDPTTPVGTLDESTTGASSADPSAQSSAQTPESSAKSSGISGSPTGSTAVSQPPAPRTVTVTATASGSASKPAAGTKTSAARATTTSAPKPTTTAPKPTTPKPKPTKPKPTKPKPKPADLGVPRADISCSDGYIVQLASELDEKAFAARVATLKAQGMVPRDAKAADSTKSCAIFANQRNTWVLYVGPYQGEYRGCAARLMGPADAFIKGANPSTAHSYVSCLCPANPATIPAIGPGSNEHGWIGELQRVLANRLNYSVGELGADQWGVYTPGTQQAVRKFQADHKLPPTGVVDARTWQQLRGAGC